MVHSNIYIRFLLHFYIVQVALAEEPHRIRESGDNKSVGFLKPS